MRISDGSSDVCSSDLSQILSEDPDAHRRTLEQEPDPEWNEFIHLAFWHDACPEAVLSIHRPPDHSQITADEHAFLEQLHPMIEASLRRVRAMEGERSRRASYEHFLRQVPLTLMFVNAAGESLFANNAAEKQSGRWNRGLRRAVSSDAGVRLQIGRAECGERVWRNV